MVPGILLVDSYFYFFSGFHLKMPLITQYEPVQVTLQTDQVHFVFQFMRIENSLLLCCYLSPVSQKMQVRDIPCGTKGGVMINFEKIEVRP